MIDPVISSGAAEVARSFLVPVGLAAVVFRLVFSRWWF